MHVVKYHNGKVRQTIFYSPVSLERINRNIVNCDLSVVCFNVALDSNQTRFVSHNKWTIHSCLLRMLYSSLILNVEIQMLWGGLRCSSNLKQKLCVYAMFYKYYLLKSKTRSLSKDNGVAIPNP